MKRIEPMIPKMRDDHWARGCVQCKYGIVSAPKLTGACELYLERLVQALHKELVFCDCEAGKRYRALLLKHRQRLIDEARRDPRMQKWAAKLTHPEIEWAEFKMLNSYEMAASVPTIHYEGVIP